MSVRGLCIAVLLCACKLPAAERGDDTAPSASVCGDGFVGANEICDDGNTAAGDGCNADCTSDETCGNGIVDADERCDDQNAIGGDGCSADCTSDETCGNGIVDAINGETCDDANLIAGDGCSANCQSNESCGNHVVDVNEQCDEGGGFTAGCDPDCTRSQCGDGIRNTIAGEQCDSSGQNTAACDANCTFPACGDSTFNPAAGEQCDNGGTNTAGCDPDCTLPACGDGRTNPAANEQCDDANGSPNDACIDCRGAFCGDGYVFFGVEQCDPTVNGGCNGGCTWDPVVYTITYDQLSNARPCDGYDNSYPYDQCAGDLGFSWTDSAPFQPSRVVVETNFGIDCSFYQGLYSYQRQVYLNGAYAGVYSIASDAPYCACGGGPTQYVGLDIGGAVGAYVRGGANSVNLPATGFCTGFADFGGGYARVYVYP